MKEDPIGETIFFSEQQEAEASGKSLSLKVWKAVKLVELSSLFNDKKEKQRKNVWAEGLKGSGKRRILQQKTETTEVEGRKTSSTTVKHSRA